MIPSFDIHYLFNFQTGDFFPAAFNCPHEVERLGALGDGGKWTCGISRLAAKRDCVVYSVGMWRNRPLGLRLTCPKASTMNPHLRQRSFNARQVARFGDTITPLNLLA